MPIYKIHRRHHAERRASERYRRVRFLALLVSALLFVATFALLYYRQMT